VRPRPAGADVAAGDEVTYLAAGGTLEVAVALAPLPAEQIGAAAAGAVERAIAGGGAAAAPSPWDASGVSPPPGWPTTAVAGAALRAPVSASVGGKTCGGCSAAASADAQRVAAIYASARFAAGAELAGLSHLRLRLRVSDGAIVWLNGREVARRRIPRGASVAAPATAAAGLEWETFYLPTGAARVGGNLLAVEVRPAAATPAPVLDVALVGARGARVVRGPIVQAATGRPTTLRFDTDVPARAAIELDAGRRLASAGGALAVHHEVVVDGLAPGREVRYRVVVDGAVGPELSFHAPPARGETVRFAVYGDTRGGHVVHGQLIEAMLGEAPDFVLGTGDLVTRGHDEADWQRFFEIAAPLLARVPLWSAAGNHDLGQTGDEERRFAELFATPAVAGRPSWASWYAFDVGDVHVVALDSNAYDRPEQEAWLRADLAAARAAGARAIIATVHHGPYSRGPHGGSPIAVARYVPILVAGGVDLLFAGHDHIYMRGERDGLRYVVSGGGGAPLYPIKCGVAGKPRCAVADGAALALSANHYLSVVVDGGTLEVCPRRPDRSLLEPCGRYPLRRR
jgi:hypothetical protein